MKSESASPPVPSARSGVRRAIAVLLLLAVAVFALVPIRHWPGGPRLDLAGAFDRRPIEFHWPHPKDTPYRLELNLDQGRCDFARLDSSRAVALSWSAQKITDRGQLHSGDTLRLVPTDGATGRYHLMVGNLVVLGGTVTVARVGILLGCVIGLLAPALRWRLPLARLNRKRWFAVTGVLAFSGLVLYSVVHEAGHVLVGWAFGGEPNWSAIRWTIFSGEEPHASFQHLPEAAAPWMSAGGVLLPTVVGLALVAIWFWLGERRSWWLQILLLLPGALLLLGNLGLFVDTDHTLVLATHWGLRGIAALVIAWSPAVLTLIVFALITRQAKRLLSGTPASGAGQLDSQKTPSPPTDDCSPP